MDDCDTIEAKWWESILSFEKTDNGSVKDIKADLTWQYNALKKVQLQGKDLYSANIDMFDIWEFNTYIVELENWFVHNIASYSLLLVKVQHQKLW